MTVTVPALARTGMVRVVGDTTELPLQIVPTLRSVGGTVAAANSVVVEGTGLVEGEITFTIDGQAVGGTVNMTMVWIRGNDQQVVDLTVPAGVSDGVITVTTAGGSFTFSPIATLADATTSGDVGDTLATWRKPSRCPATARWKSVRVTSAIAARIGMWTCLASRAIRESCCPST